MIRLGIRGIPLWAGFSSTIINNGFHNLFTQTRVRVLSVFILNVILWFLGLVVMIAWFITLDLRNIHHVFTQTKSEG